MEEQIAYKSESGIWIYTSLPEKMRVAELSDFIDQIGNIVLGINFLARSFHFSRYEAHKTKDNFLDKWKHWLDSEYIFVKEEFSL